MLSVRPSRYNKLQYYVVVPHSGSCFPRSLLDSFAYLTTPKHIKNDIMLTKKVNDIVARQWFYQSNTVKRELWMRHPRSSLYIIPYWIAFWGGLGYSGFYLGRMVVGIKG
ncbi:hypothetical protein V1512DRAFT_245233 [Lipomyces arxii]|uniref:uncharacterized protein n=1 Tax=Lipomyces arxii TaxID=56418 RepID=UPI0034CFE0A9